MSQSIKRLTRGGQTFLHNFRMMEQVAKLMVWVWLLSSVLVVGLCVWQQTTPYERAQYVTWHKARLFHVLGDNKTVTLELPSGRRKNVSISSLLASPWHRDMQAVTMQRLKQSALWGLGSGLLISMLVAALLSRRGKRLEDSRLMQGRYQGTKKELIKKLKQQGELSDLTIADVPLPKGAETQHFLFHGTTGTGKSMSIRALLDQIKARGDKAIIYDRHGDYLQYYYDPSKDKILNPMDARSEPWDVWAECRDAADFDNLAAALMPMPAGHGGDPFWINAARTLFSSGAYQLKDDPERTTEKLLNVLIMSEMEQLCALLQGTEAASLVSEKAAKTALSIKSVLATYLKCFKYLTHAKKPFSIKKWLHEDSDDWLFITSRSDKHEAIKPLISVWLDLVANGVMSLSPDSNRRIWLILDELPSLQRLPYLPQAFAESRKFGGCIVAGMQNYFQLQKIYGADGAKEIVDLCNTRLFLAASSHESASWVSKELGESEVLEVREGISYGANTIRDGVSMNHQRLMKPAVTSTEIINLPALKGYLSISPGKNHRQTDNAIKPCWPVVKVDIPVVNRKSLQRVFSDKPDEDSSGTVLHENIDEGVSHSLNEEFEL